MVSLGDYASSFFHGFLTLEVDTSLSSQRVTRAWEHSIEERGMPESIRCDNRPELTSRHFCKTAT
jgi:putative transposase